MGHFLSHLCTVCFRRHVELGAKFDFCDHFVIDLQQLCWTSRDDPQFTVPLNDLEASGAQNSDSYSDISVTSVYTCDLTDFDEDSSDSDSAGMSIFRFSAEFHFFFLLSTFLKIIFRFF